MANVLATFAQFERRLIGQRTGEALAEKRRQGVRLGRPPAIKPALAKRIRG
jgi:DNA invertase Pin-like site-specific DNA recombinase